MSVAAGMKRAGAWMLLRSRALHLHGELLEKGRAVLLLYHRVNDEGDPFFPALPTAAFAAQLEYVGRRYRVQPLEEVVAWLRAGAPGRARAAITIDDGSPDTVDVVLPELQRCGLPATLFLSTSPPETGRPLWTDHARWLLRHARAPSLEAPALGLARVSLDGTAARLEALGRLLRRLKTLAAAELLRALASLEEALDPSSAPPPRVLGWDEVRRLCAGPVTLGAHTHRHFPLSRLSEPEQEEEIGSSKRLIEERTGARVSSFAYPNGQPEDYDARTMAVLRRLAFRCAVTARHGLAGPDCDPLRLPRMYTTETSIPLFATRLSGLWRPRTLAPGSA